MDPGRASAPYVALARSGQEIAETGNYASRVVGYLEEQEKKAERAVKANKIENDLKQDMDKLAESYYSRTDFENFEPDAEKSLSGLREKYRPMAGGDRPLGFAVEKAIDDQSTSLMKVVRDKKRQVLTETGLGEFQRSYNNDIQSYISEPDPDGKALIKKKLEMKAWTLVDSHIMTFAQAETAIQKFGEDTGKAYIASLWNSGQADRAVKELNDPEMFKGMNPLNREELLRSSLVQFRVQKAEAETERHRTFEANTSKIVDTMLQKAGSGKIFTFNDLNGMLKSMGHDPANGKIAISPSEELTLKNNIQARLDHLETAGRRQPDMDETKWNKYGQLLDGIPDGTTTVQDIAKQANVMPDNYIGHLMGVMSTAGKGTQNIARKTSMDYVNGFKKLFGPISFGELKDEVSQMMQSDEFKKTPDQWFDETQKIVQRKGQSEGTLKELIRQKLTPFEGKSGIEQEKSGEPQLPSGWKKTNRTYKGKPVYIDENGKEKVWD